jgi:hypothetical protein
MQLFCSIVLVAVLCTTTNAQRAWWLYPHGSGTALPIQPAASAPQTLSAFTLKWRSAAIAGDLQPVIADIIPDAPLDSQFRIRPLEVAAVVGGRLITIDARGRLLHPSALPPFAQAISFVADSTLLPPAIRARTPSLIFLQTAEHSAHQDSMAVAYIAAYDATSDSVALVARLRYDLRPYAPNLYAWARPIFATSDGSNLAVYSVLGMTAPQQSSTGAPLPFIRGLTVSRVLPSLLGSTFPLPDVGDNIGERMTVAPHVGFDQPSIAALSPNTWLCTLPCTPSQDDTTITSPYGSTSYGRRASLFAALLGSGVLGERFPAIALDTFLSAPASKPVVMPYLVELHDGGRPQQYILLAESYRGRDGSYGQSQLHLLTTNGTALTLTRDPFNHPFRGKPNAGWSIGIGNLDGNPSNELLPYFPNNPGNEIVLTESSRQLAVPQSRLIVLRYRSGSPVPKPSPAGAVLAPLDTIVTVPMTGWLAAVADLDSAADGKAEILLADGSDLYVLRMRDYSDRNFRSGAPFDTVFHWTVPGEEITNVAIADLDGDARHDIVLTTTRATYAIGVLPSAPLRMSAAGDTTVCTRDTIELRWRYLYYGGHRVRIAFQPTASGQPILVADTLIASDTARLHIPARMLRGQTGRFVVWLSSDSTVRDSSGIVTVTSGSVVLDTIGLFSPAIAGSRVMLRGTATCLDSVRIVGSLDSGRTWQVLSPATAVTGGMFATMVDIPCIPFAPLGSADTTLLLGAIGTSSTDTAASNVQALRVSPAVVPLEISTSEPDICCTYHVRLQSGAPSCQRAAVYVQYAPSEGWTLLDSAASDSVLLRGRQGSSDTIRIRWVCRNNCLRTDTFVVRSPLRLITAIAPNPVQRGVEQCRILTTPRTNGAVTIRIFDASDRLVRTLVSNEPRIAQQMYCDIWDCRTDRGELVAPGVYYVLARSSDGWESFEAVYVR